MEKIGSTNLTWNLGRESQGNDPLCLAEWKVYFYWTNTRGMRRGRALTGIEIFEELERGTLETKVLIALLNALKRLG